ncbi:hypothetical protein CTheo_4743 [Ceratobasidium theobromae]|uniref:Transmembrane protein n=1 Tax=Ceratobasidium theobromae TaxID=1582974 RepID=A0A5N5QKH8_9AGAM|nr:hypothetical protein CTheo_4743 [Ceratobasidium theobromae]
MLLPRADSTQATYSPTVSLTATETASATVISRSSTYNLVSFVIAGITAGVGLMLFYLLYWRKRPSRSEAPQLVVSRTGVAYVRTRGTRERRRIIEQVRREQEASDRCEAEWGVRRMQEHEQQPRGCVGLPTYSRSPEPAQVGRSQMEDIGTHMVIQIPPPAYDQTGARPSSRILG